MERMTIRPLSIPRIRFAHEYGSDDYDITFPIISNQLEISYLVEGDVLWESGEERLQIPEGSVVVNDFARVFRQYGDGHACRHRTVGLRMAYEREGEGAVALPRVCPPGVVSAQSDRLISRIITEYTVSGSASAKSVSLVFELLDYLDRKAGIPAFSGEGMSATGAAFADAALHYLAEHLDRAVTVEEVAAHIHISPGYLSAVFKQYTGQSVIGYFNRLKMERVCELMRVRGLTLKQAGVFVGLLDENYLSRMFRRYTGKNVKEFQKNQ